MATSVVNCYKQLYILRSRLLNHAIESKHDLKQYHMSASFQYISLLSVYMEDY